MQQIAAVWYGMLNDVDPSGIHMIWLFCNNSKYTGMVLSFFSVKLCVFVGAGRVVPFHNNLILQLIITPIPQERGYFHVVVLPTGCREDHDDVGKRFNPPNTRYAAVESVNGNNRYLLLTMSSLKGKKFIYFYEGINIIMPFWG